jgi:hypothetical protein
MSTTDLMMMSTDMMTSLLFTPDRALYPDEDLAMCVQTPRAFSADGGARALSAEWPEGALSATPEQSEPRTPFDWSDQARTMQEEEQVRFWAEDADLDREDAEPSFCGDKRALSSEAEAAEYYSRREATPRLPPSPIGDYAVVADPAPAPGEAAPVNQKKVRVYFSGQRMWGGAAPPKRSRRAQKAPKPLRVALPMGEDATLARGALVTHSLPIHSLMIHSLPIHSLPRIKMIHSLPIHSLPRIQMSRPCQSLT